MGGRNSVAASAAPPSSSSSSSSSPLSAPLLPPPFLPSPSHVPLHPSAVRQIAGRAGRASSPWPEGLAATLRPEDLPYLRAALSAPPDDGGAAGGGGKRRSPGSTGGTGTPSAGLFPEPDQLEAYAGRHPGLAFPALLRALAADARLDGRYFFSQQEAVVAAAELLELVPGLALRERFALASAPASARDARQGAALLAYARALAAGGAVPLFAPLPSSGAGAGAGALPAALAGGGGGGEGSAAEERRLAAFPLPSVVPRVEDERAERVFAAAAAAVARSATAAKRMQRKTRGGDSRGAPPPTRSFAFSSSSSSSLRTPREVTRAAALLKDAEDAHAIVTLWRWLARRFGEERFPSGEAELAAAEAARLAALLDRGLASMAAAAASSSPSKKRGKRGAVAAAVGDEEEEAEKKKKKKTSERRGKGGAGSSASAAAAAAKDEAALAAAPSPSGPEIAFSLSEEGQEARSVVSPAA